MGKANQGNPAGGSMAANAPQGAGGAGSGVDQSTGEPAGSNLSAPAANNPGGAPPESRAGADNENEMIAENAGDARAEEPDKPRELKAADFERRETVPTRDGGTVEVDSRLSAMLATASPLDRFIALMLSAAVGVDGTAAVLDTITPRTGNFSGVVEGNPLIHYLGKTREQIANDFPEDDEETREKRVEAVSQAMKAQGRTVLTERQAKAPKHDEEIRESDPGKTRLMPSAKRPDMRLAAGNRGEAIGGEKTFAGYPFSEVAGLSDDDLLKRPGMNRNAIAELRKAEAARRQ